LQLPVASAEKYPFGPHDDSVTALVSHIHSPVKSSGKTFQGPEAERHNHLPDDAAGVFDPGWDVSLDHLPGKKTAAHFAAYGLGSPFPEDAKLCAALSAFWPAVSPDTTRVMEPRAENTLQTTCPLTDEEIGQSGLLPWDGVAGPRVVVHEGKEYAEFADFHHVDYVQNALEGKFSMHLLAKVDSREYEMRVLAMAAVHSTLESNAKHWRNWIVLSFRVVSPSVLGDVEQLKAMRQAVKAARIVWGGPIYRFEMIKRPNEAIVARYDFRKRLLPVPERRLFFVDPERGKLAFRTAQGTWRHQVF
jgi:hypothetical protein